MWLTNVATNAIGTDCPSPTASDACATLFQIDAAQPGEMWWNGVTVTYLGTGSTTGFHLYARDYVPRAPTSSALCTAVDPGAGIVLELRIGTRTIYPLAGGDGSLATFASSYDGLTGALDLDGAVLGTGAAGVWRTGDWSTFTIGIGYAPWVDNSYQGCASSIALVWQAER